MKARNIGEMYGGGIIFFLYKDTMKNEHGLIASLKNVGTDIWSNVTNVSILTTNNSSWDGSSNTSKIITNSSSSAAQIAKTYSGGSYPDWYLPSIDELIQLSNVRFLINKILDRDGFSLNAYWSSTESGPSNAWSFHFGSNSGQGETKSSARLIRAIRQF